MKNEHHQRVAGYYDLAQKYYSLFWHGSSRGLHYGIWGKGISNRREAIIHENRVLADLAGIKKGDLVLDAGCGIGGSGIWLARKREARVLGLNITRSQLVRAQKFALGHNLSKSLRFVEGDYQQLPVWNNSIDVFWSLESIEHATDPGLLIKEAYRVVKPGGRIVMAAMFKGREQVDPIEQIKLDTFQEVSGCFENFKTAQQIELLMGEAGFVGVENTDATDKVMESSRQIRSMCRWGLPVAQLLAHLKLVSPRIVANNQWGLYQEQLFDSGAISYNILSADRP